MACRVKRIAMYHSVGSGGFLVNAKLEHSLSNTYLEIQKIDLTISYFDGEFNRRVEAVDKIKEH